MDGSLLYVYSPLDELRTISLAATAKDVSFRSSGRYGFFFFSSRRRHTRFDCDWSSDVCSSDLARIEIVDHGPAVRLSQAPPSIASRIERRRRALGKEDVFVGVETIHEGHVFVQDRKSVV